MSEAIAALESQIQERSTIQSLSRNVLFQLTTLQKQMEELSKQNELYDKYKEIQTSLTDLKDYISKIKQSYLDEIQNQINIKMEFILQNNHLCLG